MVDFGPISIAAALARGNPLGAANDQGPILNAQ